MREYYYIYRSGDQYFIGKILEKGKDTCNKVKETLEKRGFECICVFRTFMEFSNREGSWKKYNKNIHSGFLIKGDDGETAAICQVPALMIPLEGGE